MHWRRALIVAAIVSAIVAALVLLRDQPAEITRPSSTPSASGAVSRPVVVAGPAGLLGWWDGTKWVQWRAGVDVPVVGGEKYRVIRLGRSVSAAVGSSPREGCIRSTDPPALGIDFPRGGHWFTPAIAVTGDHALHPRPTERLDRGAGVYREAADDVLSELRIEHDRPTISQIVRTDLEGDDVDEVVIITERISDPRTLFAEPGDFSVVFVRRVRRGDVETEVLAKSKAPAADAKDATPFVETHRLAAVADLNGDGTLEVVVASVYYEGSASAVHEVQADGTIDEVLSAGCGA